MSKFYGRPEIYILILSGFDIIPHIIFQESEKIETWNSRNNLCHISYWIIRIYSMSSSYIHC